MLPASHISPYTSLVGFLIGMPTSIATYYQAWKARQENRELREGLAYSSHCLEFVLEDGTSINLVPLETLHSLPKPGEIVLLPGTERPGLRLPQHGAYRVLSIEHLYARVLDRRAFAGQARLVKTVANIGPVAP